MLTCFYFDKVRDIGKKGKEKLKPFDNGNMINIVICSTKEKYKPFANLTITCHIPFFSLHVKQIRTFHKHFFPNNNEIGSIQYDASNAIGIRENKRKRVKIMRLHFFIILDCSKAYFSSLLEYLF